jgi:CBS domain-containing protein
VLGRLLSESGTQAAVALSSGFSVSSQRAHCHSAAVSFLSLSTDPVTDAFPDPSLAVSGDATVGDVMQLMRAQRGSCVLVCSDDGALEGIFTERDALRWMTEGGATQTNIREVMTPRPAHLAAKATVDQAIRAMSEGGYRHLPILDDAGVPQGVVAVRGIVHYLVDHFPNTIYTLPPEPGNRASDREGA